MVKTIDLDLVMTFIPTSLTARVAIKTEKKTCIICKEGASCTNSSRFSRGSKIRHSFSKRVIKLNSKYKPKFCAFMNYNFRFKRKIRTCTGILTSDLQISSVALCHLSYPGSIDGKGLNFPLECNAIQSLWSVTLSVTI